MDQVEQLQKILDKSGNTVFFGGAGVSTASGIPDFRSADGLYHQNDSVPPETLLSRGYFRTHPEEFFRFHREKVLHLEAEPNAAHRKLAELEQAGKLRGIITQNIDGLHQKAGSRRVLELHGTALRNHCESCGREYPAAYVKAAEGTPLCSCGGVVCPDVVLYGDQLDQEVLEEAVRLVREAEVLLIGGTSLVVYPAAGLVDYFRGDSLVIVNKSPTAQDRRADLAIAGDIAAVFAGIKV